jgi:hypothetical protein
MKLTLQLRLLPDAVQRKTLLASMERVNQAATFAAHCGFDAHVFSQAFVTLFRYGVFTEVRIGGFCGSISPVEEEFELPNEVRLPEYQDPPDADEEKQPEPTRAKVIDIGTRQPVKNE